MKLSIKLYIECHFAECRDLCIVMLNDFTLIVVCWVSLCWVSLCWVPLCCVSLSWMSWHPISPFILSFQIHFRVSDGVGREPRLLLRPGSSPHPRLRALPLARPQCTLDLRYSHPQCLLSPDESHRLQSWKPGTPSTRTKLERLLTNLVECVQNVKI
jgi:hypothetical protein